MQKFGIILIFSMAFLAKTRAQQTVLAANHFLNSLSKEQQLATLFPFESEERYNYHFVPFERKGITFNDMNEAQKKAALFLLKTCLSEETYSKVAKIRELEIFLKELEKRKPEDHFRDPNNYHFSIFGIPANNTTWGWRYEGHHQSFNFSFNKGIMVSGTPGFMGSNPGTILEGPRKGEQVLKEETEMGFQLLQSLNADQQKLAVYDTTAPPDILSFDKKRIEIYPGAGIRYDQLQTNQQQLMLKLINLHVHRFTKLFAEEMLKDIQSAGLANLRFCWAGKKTFGLGNPNYYRVQGTTFLIEYDNTQNNSNHVHSVVRDLKNDFGGDELLEHYKKEHTN